MYTNTVAAIRRDINVFLEQAQGAEKYFIGQKLLPVMNVEDRAAQYPRIKIGEGGLLRRDVTKRNATGTYNEITRKHSWDSYTCEDRGLKERIDDDKVADMKNYLSLEVKTAQLVRRNMLIDFEVAVKDKIFDDAVFLAENARIGYTEALIATCDFPYDINLSIEKLVLRGVDVNTIVLSQKLWNYIRRTKLLQDYIYGSQDTTKRKLIKRSDIASAFTEENARDIDVVVAAAGYDISNRAKDTPSLTQIWPASHIWVGQVASGGFESGGVGRTLSWTGSVKGKGLFQTETWRDEDRRGDMVRVRSNSIEKVIDETAGQLVVTGFN
jgi:hypothetical protein